MDTTSRNPTRKASLKELLLQEDLHDPWRYQHTSERDYTFFSNPHNTYSRIDCFITDKSLLQRVMGAKIYNITWSDHAPISLEISDSLTCNGIPLWRNNTFILSHPEYAVELRTKLELFLLNAESSSSVFNLWCAHKAFARGVLIQLSSRDRKREIYRFPTYLLK